MSALRTTSLHLRVSASMKPANSAALPPRGCRPSAISLWRSAGSFSARLASALSRSTVRAGVPAGAIRPNQP